jgi:hypothetical protein
MKYIFVVNLVGDINVNTIQYNLVKVKLVWLAQIP